MGHIIFPVNTPIDRLGGSSEVETPEPLSGEVFNKVSSRVLKRLRPLLQIREDANKAYNSQQYFEQYYPEADKKMKNLLHQRAMLAWANALNDDDSEELSKSSGLGRGITININLGE